MAPGCPAGNVTNDNLYHYLYDAEGRLCAVQDLTGDAVTAYVYDAEGRRVAKGTLSSWPTACVSPTSHNFTLTTSWVLGLNGEQVSEIAVSGSANTWQHTNVFAGGGLLATYHDTNTYIELNDWLGTRRAEVGASRCYQSYYSDPYGDTVFTLEATCTPDATEQHFTGKERDAESGNDYFGARYYASSMGRFMSPDWSAKEEPVPYAKLDNPQTLNLYSYVENNPLTGEDADGHQHRCSTIECAQKLEANGGAKGEAIAGGITLGVLAAPELGIGAALRAGWTMLTGWALGNPDRFRTLSTQQLTQSRRLVLQASIQWAPLQASNESCRDIFSTLSTLPEELLKLRGSNRL